MKSKKQDSFGIPVIDSGEFDPESEAILRLLCLKYDIKSGRKCIVSRNRNVFILNNCVVKIPRNLNGNIDNDWEGSIKSSDDPNEIQYSLNRHFDIYGLTILFMEYVYEANLSQIKSKLGHIPDWVYSVDCQQVGFNRRGRLVAYDYGLT